MLLNILSEISFLFSKVSDEKSIKCIASKYAVPQNGNWYLVRKRGAAGSEFPWANKRESQKKSAPRQSNLVLTLSREKKPQYRHN